MRPASDGTLMYKIHWQGCPGLKESPEDVTWEVAETFDEQDCLVVHSWLRDKTSKFEIHDHRGTPSGPSRQFFCTANFHARDTAINTSVDAATSTSSLASDLQFDSELSGWIALREDSEGPCLRFIQNYWCNREKLRELQEQMEELKELMAARATAQPARPPRPQNDPLRQRKDSLRVALSIAPANKIEQLISLRLVPERAIAFESHSRLHIDVSELSACDISNISTFLAIETETTLEAVDDGMDEDGSDVSDGGSSESVE